MKELYTAIGRLEMRRDGLTKKHPLVVAGRKEHLLDIHEMMIWSCLNWGFTGLVQLEEKYHKKLTDAGIDTDGDFRVYVERLLLRGLIVKGSGDTDADAAYDLIGGLYIQPVPYTPFDKAALFAKLTLSKGVPFRRAAREALRKTTYSADEKRVWDLIMQAFLSTAELMKCVEVGAMDISNEDKLTDAIYTDDYTTCDNLVFTARTFDCKIRVLTALANLYLRRQIIFTEVGCI